jgi:hypothetical protein
LIATGHVVLVLKKLAVHFNRRKDKIFVDFFGRLKKRLVHDKKEMG